MVRTPFTGVLVLFLDPPFRSRQSEPAGSGARHRWSASTKSPAWTCRWAKKDWSWLLQRRHGHRPSSSSQALLTAAWPRALQQEGGGGGSKCHGTAVEEDGASVASTETGACRLIHFRRRSAPSRSKRCAAPTCDVAPARGQFQSGIRTLAERWYVLAGEQCLETLGGALTGWLEGATTVKRTRQWKLNVTVDVGGVCPGHRLDRLQERGMPSDWKPSGACSQ